jgi:ubiquinone/menaquinone biosynthesis C-methylase UbiE
MSVFNRLRHHLFSANEIDPKEAYDIWALYYDAQPDNLMLHLDEAIFNELIEKVNFQDKTFIDVGCGTGRHWEKIYAKQPKRIIGYDISEGMLKVLKKKFPEAEANQVKNNRLEGLENASCDIVISTLALAHIEDIGDAFAEWSRVLKKDGHIIITDYHPDTLSKGGDRTFMHNGKRISIKNHIHPIEEIGSIANKFNFKVGEFIERKIDESVKDYYEKQQAIKVFERFKGTRIIYGAHLIRTDVIK